MKAIHAIKILGLLWTLPGLPAGNCGHLLTQRPSFGDVFDLYADGALPTFSFLASREWRLTGVFNHRKADHGIGTVYDPTGVVIGSRVPTLSFLSKLGLKLSDSPQVRVAASFATQDHYAIAYGWNAEALVPRAIQSPLSKGVDEKKRAVSFYLSCAGGAGELFPAEESAPGQGELVQFYCRINGASLICLTENLRNDAGTVVRGKISTIFIFE